jgi:hypothetical protein
MGKRLHKCVINTRHVYITGKVSPVTLDIKFIIKSKKKFKSKETIRRNIENYMDSIFGEIIDMHRDM